MALGEIVIIFVPGRLPYTMMIKVLQVNLVLKRGPWWLGRAVDVCHVTQRKTSDKCDQLQPKVADMCDLCGRCKLCQAAEGRRILRLTAAEACDVRHVRLPKAAKICD